MASSIISAKIHGIFTGLLSRRVVLLGARQRRRHEKNITLKGRAVQDKRHWQKASWSNPCDQSLALYLRPQTEDEHVTLWFAAEATRSQVQRQALITRIYRHPTNTYEIYSLTSVRCSDTRTMQDLISA